MQNSEDDRNTQHDFGETFSLHHHFLHDSIDIRIFHFIFMQCHKYPDISKGYGANWDKEIKEKQEEVIHLTTEIVLTKEIVHAKC